MIHSWVAKRHCPKTCEYCNLPVDPVQGRERCFAGSRLWYRGWHMGCIFKDTYGEALRVEIEQRSKENPLFKLLKDAEDFSGGFYSLPVPLRY